MEYLNTHKLLLWAGFIALTWLVMIIAVMIDLWTGIEKAKAKKEDIHSGKIRKTVAKIGEYWRILMMFICIDALLFWFQTYTMPFATLVGTIAIICIEIKSVNENMREKRSSAADIIDVAHQIIKCNKVEEAIKLIRDVKTICHGDK